MASHTVNVNSIENINIPVSGETNRTGIFSKFDATAYGLERSFCLVRFADMKSKGLKPAQAIISMVERNATYRQKRSTSCRTLSNSESLYLTALPADSSITPIKQGALALIQASSFTHPIIDDPYIIGKIACADIINGLYEMGAMECDNILMVLAVSSKLSDKERDIIVPLMIRGFKDFAVQSGTDVCGGHTAYNPWLMIGGTATSVCEMSNYIVNDNATIGDVLVLTKPLGTQVAVNAFLWIGTNERWYQMEAVISQADTQIAYSKAISSMLQLNYTGILISSEKNFQVRVKVSLRIHRIRRSSDATVYVTAAILMRKYEIHAVTHVGGSGILGHAKLLAKKQKNDVNFVIHNLPIIANMAAVNKACNDMFGLMEGVAPETSGGLLICMKRKQAADYIQNMEDEGYQAWVVGVAERGNKTARLIQKPRIIEVL